eukprot:215270-Chlamydomonas_euryale.AAC.1
MVWLHGQHGVTAWAAWCGHMGSMVWLHGQHGVAAWAALLGRATSMSRSEAVDSRAVRALHRLPALLGAVGDEQVEPRAARRDRRQAVPIPAESVELVVIVGAAVDRLGRGRHEVVVALKRRPCSGGSRQVWGRGHADERRGQPEGMEERCGVRAAVELK